MPTYRLDLAYDGSGFRGWAANAGVRTVQGCLEDALAVALRHPVETAVAGRTDAGVHARGQVVSFTVPEAIDAARLQRSLNRLLAPEVVVRARGRGSRGLRRPPLRHLAHLPLLPRRRSRARPGPSLEHLARRGTPLDEAAMNPAAAGFLGEHDFASLCRAVGGRRLGAPGARRRLVAGVRRRYWSSR